MAILANGAAPIKGVDIYQMITIGITLGKSQKANISDENSHFAIFELKDPDFWQSGITKTTIFAADMSMGCWNALYECVDDKTKTITVNGKTMPELRVNLKKVAENPLISPYLVWRGATSAKVPLKKGLCYCNDVNGNIRTYKNGTPVTRDYVSVLCLVKEIRPDGTYVYAEHWSPEERAERIENTFFIKKVESGTASETQFADGASQVSRNPFEQAATQSVQQNNAPQGGGQPINNGAVPQGGNNNQPQF